MFFAIRYYLLNNYLIQSNSKNRVGDRIQLVVLIFILCFIFSAGLSQSNITKSNFQGPYGVEVNTWNGNLFYERTDLIIAAIGDDIMIEFDYNSRNNANDYGFGKGWTMCYNMFYSVDGGGNVSMNKDDGRVDVFNWTGTTYDAPIGNFETLKQYLPNQYRLSTRSGTHYYFDDAVNKKVSRIKDRNGNSIDLNYNVNNELILIQNSCGTHISLNWSGGHLTGITDSTELPYRTYIYSYNGSNQLIQYTDPAGFSEKYSYDGNDRLDSLTNKNGNSVAISYHVSGAVQTLTNPISAQSMSYNTMSLETSILQMVGGDFQTTIYSYDSGGRLISRSGTCCGYSTTGYTYDAQNNVTQVTDANGHTTTYAYDTRGQIISELDALSNMMSYTYDYTNDQITKVTDKNGNESSYHYDANGNLIQSVRPHGATQSFTYDAIGRLTKKTDENANQTSYAYDACGNPVADTLPLGYNRQYSYNNRSDLIDQTNTNGCVTTYTYDLMSRRTSITDPQSSVTGFTYDPLGNMLSSSDNNGNLTTYAYDVLNRLISKSEPVGVTTSTTYNEENLIAQTDPNGNLATYSYDSLNRLVQEIDAMTNLDKYEYDAKGNLSIITDPLAGTTRYYYDALDRVIAMVNAKGDTLFHIYDGNGNTTSTTDQEGKTTTFEYDSLNRMIEMTNALSGVTMYTYDAHSNRIRETDANTNETHYSYDELHRVDTLTDVLSNTEVYTYDGENNLLTRKDRNGNTTTFDYDCLDRITTITNPLNETVAYTYDSNSNEIQRRLPNSNTIILTYDSLNRIKTITDSLGPVSQYTYDGNGNLTSKTDGLSHTTTYTYDNLDRLTREIDPQGESQTYTYDANSNIVTDTNRNGRVTRYEYDNLDRLIKKTDPLGGFVLSDYDKIGNLIDFTDEKGNTTQYTYDPIYRRTRETFDDNSTRRYTYDAVGNGIQRIDNNGDTTIFTYDALNRLTTRDYPDSNDDSFTYDFSGRLLTANNNNASVTFTYDNADRLLSEILNGKTTTYAFDQSNNKRTIGYPNGRQIIRKFDLRDRLEIINEGSDTLAHFEYDVANRLTQRNYLNGTNTQITYNNNDWITQIQHNNPGLIAGFNYDYEKEGNKIYADYNHKSDFSEEYQYDALERLTTYKKGTLSGTTIPVPTTQSVYTYDAARNRLLENKNGTFTDYISNNMNEYDVISGPTFSIRLHDANGNLKEDGANQYTYDFENRLIQIGNETTYAFDPLGRRVRKVSEGYITNYYYDKLNVITEILENPNCPYFINLNGVDQSVIKTYEAQNYIKSIKQIIDNSNITYSANDSILLGPEFYVEQGSEFQALMNGCVVANDIPDTTSFVYGTWVDDVLCMHKSGSTYFYHHIALGSVSTLTDMAGVVVERYEYDGYGQVSMTNNSYDTLNQSVVGNPYFFNGRRLDAETGLFYYRARHYDPQHGRFLQRDPLGYVNGMNLYEYVGGNPINLVDPLGLDFENLGWKWGGKLSKGVGGLTNVYYNVVLQCYCVKRGDFRMRVVSTSVKTRLSISKHYKYSKNRHDKDGTDLAQGIYGHEMKHAESIEAAVNAAEAQGGSIQAMIADCESRSYGGLGSCNGNIGDWRAKFLKALKKVIDDAAGHDDDDDTDKPEAGRKYHDDDLPDPTTKSERKRQNKRLKGYETYPLPKEEW